MNSELNIGKKWTEEEDKNLIELYNNKKLGIFEISDTLKRTPVGVSSRLVKHGIIDCRWEARGYENYNDYKKSDYYEEINNYYKEKKEKHLKKNDNQIIELKKVLEEYKKEVENFKKGLNYDKYKNELNDLKNDLKIIKNNLSELLDLFKMVYTVEEETVDL